MIIFFWRVPLITSFSQIFEKKSSIKRLSSEQKNLLKYEPKNIVLKTIVLGNVTKMMFYVFDHCFNNNKDSELPISDTVHAENREDNCTTQHPDMVHPVNIYQDQSDSQDNFHSTIAACLHI